MGEFKIDDKSYEYDSLNKKYSQFMSPSMRIFINNEDVTGMLKISEAEVENSVYKSGFFSFKVTNAYNNVKKDFLFDDKLSVGNSIKIDLGYKNKLATVFSGLISSISYSISSDEGPIVTVSGLDKSFLMMKGRKSSIWQEKTHSDIVKSIAGKYQLKAKADDTSVKYETVVQNQLSDFEFITYLANVNSFEFFVMGENLYFREINKEKSSAITLTMFENIIHANIGKDVGDLISSTVVRGYSLKKEETEVVMRNVNSLNQSKTGTSILNSLDSKNLMHYIYEPNLDKQSAEKIAKSYLEKNAMNYIFGDICIIGVPDITAGRYITIKGINGKDSKSLLYAKNVKHVIDDNGYTTFIEIGGNSL